jgi:pimeloyl-ACP methyl ester carboxylesterase
MLEAEVLRAESGRYAAPLVLVPGLWAGRDVWRPAASFLAHRGWECRLLDLRSLGGGLTERATALAEYAAAEPSPPVLVGHDVGGLVALAAARRVPVRALVLLAPLLPRGAAFRAIALRPRALPALVLGRRVVPPRGRAALALYAELPDGHRRQLLPESAALVLDVARGRVHTLPAEGTPTLMIAGGDDALAAPSAARSFAAGIGAELEEVAGAGHWLLLGPGWEGVVGLVHRWLVRRLGEPLLEYYQEAMAERDEEPD